MKNKIRHPTVRINELTSIDVKKNIEKRSLIKLDELISLASVALVARRADLLRTLVRK